MLKTLQFVAVQCDAQPRRFRYPHESVDGFQPFRDHVALPGLGRTDEMKVRGGEGRHHMGGHGPGDVSAHVLEHEGTVVRGEQTGPAHRDPDFLMSEHVGVRGLHEHFVRRLRGEVVQHDGQPGTLTQFDVALNISRWQRIFEAAGYLEPLQLVQEFGHVVVGAVHGEIVVHPEPFWRHRLHGLGLIHDVLEGR